jgi:hypothetical protein
MRAIAHVAIALLTAGLPVITAAQDLNPLTLEQFGAKYLPEFATDFTWPDRDYKGYGPTLAWSASYHLMALAGLYEVTGDTEYLEEALALIEAAFTRRDSDLAAKYPQHSYVDYFKHRPLRSWGKFRPECGNSYMALICNVGMPLYGMARCVRLIREGGEATAPYLQRANALVPMMEAAIAEFDVDWREGPAEGMGYYVMTHYQVAPNNISNSVGRALFALYDITDKPEYLIRATKLATFFKSKLTHVEDGDYYQWAYEQHTPDGPPGTGEDISHAAINAHFMYVAWEHGAAFDDTDMQRLASTFTHAFQPDATGGFSWDLGKPDRRNLSQSARWLFLARFDPAIEQSYLEFVASRGDIGPAGSTLAALAYSYLLRARHLRQ